MLARWKCPRCGVLIASLYRHGVFCGCGALVNLLAPISENDLHTAIVLGTDDSRKKTPWPPRRRGRGN